MNKKGTGTRFITVVLSIVVGFILINHFLGRYVVNFLSFTNLILAFVLVCALLRIGKTPISAYPCAQKTTSTWQWILQIVWLQLICVNVYFVLLTGFLQIPTDFSTHLKVSFLTVNYFYEITQQGFHPWGLVLLCVIFFGVMGASKQRARVSGAMIYLPIRISGFFAAMADISVLLGILLNVYFLLVVLFIALADLVAYWFNIVVPWETAYALTAIFCAGIFFRLRLLRQGAWRGMQHFRQMGGALLFIFVAQALMLVLALYVLSFFTADLLTPLKRMNPVALSSGMDPLRQWIFFAWMVACFMAPWIAGIIVRWSQDRSLRQVIGVTLFLPVTIGVSFQIFIKTHMQQANDFLLDIEWFLQSVWYDFYVCMIIAVVFFYLIKNTHVNLALIHLLPNSAGKKIWRLNRFLLRVSMLFTAIFALFLMAQSSGLRIVWTSMGWAIWLLGLFPAWIACVYFIFSKKSTDFSP